MFSRPNRPDFDGFTLVAKRAKRQKHRPAVHGASIALSPQDRLGSRALVIWTWLAGYLAAYYAWPLSSASGQGLRRGHFWITLLLGDETFARWFEDFCWESLVQRAEILGWGGAILLAATAGGWIALRALGVGPGLTKLESFVFSAGVGLNLASTATLALGLCGILRFEAFAGLAVAAVLAAAWLGWRQHAGGARVPPAAAESSNGSAHSAASDLQLSNYWLWLAVPFVIAMLAGAMLPPIDFDVREYHLQAPKEFYQNGRIAFLPHNIYANMPLGSEMLSLLGMVASGDWWMGALVGKTLIAAFAPLAAAALFAAGRRFVSPAAGLLAALVYISLPWIALVSTQGLVEGALAFYLFAALYALLLWRAHSGATAGAATRAIAPWKWLALGGFLSGGAVSTKYPALLFSVLPLSVYVIYRSLRSPRAENSRSANRAGLFRFFAASREKGGRPLFPGFRNCAKSLGVFLLACLLGCGLWFAKNAPLAGNPTYPLLYGFFGGETRTPQLDAQWSRAHGPPNYDLDDLARRAVRVLVASDWLGPLVVPLAVLAWLSRHRRLVRLLAAYLAFIFAAWWLATHRIDRFWVPALPLAALLAGIGGAWSDRTWWRATLAAFVAPGLVFNFAVISGPVLIDNRFLADLEVLRVDPTRVEPWHRYLNEHADQVRTVLLVGDAQPFDLEVPVVYNTVFDASIFEQLARCREADEVRAALEARGISHVYVCWREIDRYRSPGNYGITGFLQPRVFALLVADGVLEPLPPIRGDSGQMFRVLPRR